MKTANQYFNKNSIGYFALCVMHWVSCSVTSSAVEIEGLPEQFSAEVSFAIKKTMVTNQVFRDHGEFRMQAISKTTNVVDNCMIGDWDSGQIMTVYPILKQYMRTLIPDPSGFSTLQESWLLWPIYAPRTVQLKMGQEHKDNMDWDRYMMSNAFMTAYLYTRTTPQPVMELHSTNGILLCSWTNIVVGPQPPELFSMPEDYKPSRLPQVKPMDLGRRLAALKLPDEFYVEEVLTVQVKEVSTIQSRKLRQKIWCKGDQMRREAIFGEKRGWGIYDFGKGIQMIVDDARQRIIVTPLNLCAGPVGQWEANLLWDGTAIIEEQGMETVNGKQLIKRRLSNAKGSAIYYATVEKNAPVQIVAQSGVLLAKWENFTHTNISDEVFQIPASYKRLEY